MTISDYTNLNSNVINQILIAILKKDSAFLISHQNEKLTKFQINKIDYLYKKYKNNWPLPYLLNYCHFYQLKLELNQSVLIPRPETEIMLDIILEKVRKKPTNEKINILDLGTGSGAIIINLAYVLKNYKNISFFASDISRLALKVAIKNAKNHFLGKRIDFFLSNLLKNVNLNNNKLYITANLPYLSYKELKNPSLKKEPKLALYGGKNGLDIYKQLLIELKKFNKTKIIILLLEINPRQRLPLIKLIKTNYPQAKIIIHKDLRNKNRFLELIINN